MPNPSKKGNIIVLTGPSGVGKGVIVKRLTKKHTDIVLSVSATTRSPRPKEKDGVNYYFVTTEIFNNMVDSGEMLEWAKFAGNYYGTPKSSLEQEINNGNDVILEIEVQGALNVKKIIPDCLMIFILPPSIEELKRRLINRATEPYDIIQKRLKIALSELEHKEEFHYQVINENLDNAVETVETIILNFRNRQNQ